MATKSVEQKAIDLIKSFAPIKTTQDAVDVAASELYVADLLRKNAEARYEQAKKVVLAAAPELIEDVRKYATNNMQKYSDYIHGEDWSIQISANTPAKRVNIDELRTALIKAGVKVGVIDACVHQVEKLSTPATSIKGIQRVKSSEAA